MESCAFPRESTPFSFVGCNKAYENILRNIYYYPKLDDGDTNVDLDSCSTEEKFFFSPLNPTYKLLQSQEYYEYRVARKVGTCTATLCLVPINIEATTGFIGI